VTETFRRPLGLVLSGGGALGCWQAAALRVLEADFGLAFDAVLGFSAGALTGSSYALDLMEETVARWRALDGGILRFSPRLWPPSIFSEHPIWETVDYAADDERAKERVRCRLVVVSARAKRDNLVYGVFTQAGREGWDGALAAHLVASCSIPLVFPRQRLSYRGEDLTLIDGGIPCREPLSFAPLGPCRDVLVLEMVRPEEMRAKPRGFFRRIDLMGRQTVRRALDAGVAGLLAQAEPPRVFRLAPSRVLDFTMLDFSADKLRQGLLLGESDARAFMSLPSSFAANSGN